MAAAIAAPSAMRKKLNAKKLDVGKFDLGRNHSFGDHLVMRV